MFSARAILLFYIKSVLEIVVGGLAGGGGGWCGSGLTGGGGGVGDRYRQKKKC